MLYNIANKERWLEFLSYKKDCGHLCKAEERDLTEFIKNEEYTSVFEKIKNGAPFPLPKLNEINKKGSEKKRKVFIFDRCENYVLKLIAYLLHKYDVIFSPNLYSFRRDIGVKKAVTDLLKKQSGREFYSYKVDIHDYFNSVDTDLITELVQKTFTDDIPLARFINQILTEKYCIYENKVISHKKGIMAGVPISGFLANLYLKDLDEWFCKRGIIYARYSDDIIVFAKTKEEIAEYEKTIKAFLNKMQLEINQKKEIRTAPGERWEFLGFSFYDKTVDISEIAMQKIKAKIKRKARALVRWKKRANATDERAIRAFIRYFNNKFYNNRNENDITWCRWYFPTVNTDKSLHLIDEYMLSNIRFIATGKHTKANYNLRYEEIKKLGYRSLVNAFHRYKKTNCL